MLFDIVIIIGIVIVVDQRKKKKMQISNCYIGDYWKVLIPQSVTIAYNINVNIYLKGKYWTNFALFHFNDNFH